MTLSITLIIILVTVVVSFMSFQNPALKDKLMLHPAAMDKEGEWYRFISHGFVHADSMHLLINMFVLYMFGITVEAWLNSYFAMGTLIYVALYFLALVIAATPSFLKHKDNYLYRSLGASGATAAVLYCYILFAPDQNLYLYFAIPIPAVVFGVLYIAYEYYMGQRGRGNINHDAHLYGAIFGFVFPLLFDLKLINYFMTGVQNLLDRLA